MNVVAPATSESSTTRAVPLPHIVSVPPQRRVRLLDRVVTVGCELVALGLEAAASLVESRVPDRAADRHVEMVDALAARLAMLAHHHVLDDETAMTIAVQIRQHAAGYRVEDAREDGLVVAAHGLVGRIVAICRALNVRLTKEIAKRGGARV